MADNKEAPAMSTPEELPVVAWRYDFVLDLKTPPKFAPLNGAWPQGNSNWREVPLADHAYATAALSELRAEVERLRLECERLRVDAERYRWLRANREAQDKDTGCIHDVYDEDGAMLMHESLDDAIDAAMKKERT
jgi:hypothetical protein